MVFKAHFSKDDSYSFVAKETLLSDVHLENALLPISLKKANPKNCVIPEFSKAPDPIEVIEFPEGKVKDFKEVHPENALPPMAFTLPVIAT